MIRVTERDISRAEKNLRRLRAEYDAAHGQPERRQQASIQIKFDVEWSPDTVKFVDNDGYSGLEVALPEHKVISIAYHAAVGALARRGIQVDLQSHTGEAQRGPTLLVTHEEES